MGIGQHHGRAHKGADNKHTERRQVVEMITRLYTRKEVSAMVRAIRTTGMFDIVRTRESAIVTLKSSKKEVFRSLCTGHGVWITRLYENLFL